MSIPEIVLLIVTAPIWITLGLGAVCIVVGFTVLPWLMLLSVLGVEWADRMCKDIMKD